MSKYYKAEDIFQVIDKIIQNATETDAETIMDTGLVIEINKLPTIDIVPCEECMWYNDCLQFVTSIDRTATALRWCSDGERIEE